MTAVCIWTAGTCSRPARVATPCARARLHRQTPHLSPLRPVRGVRACAARRSLPARRRRGRWRSSCAHASCVPPRLRCSPAPPRARRCARWVGRPRDRARKRCASPRLSARSTGRVREGVQRPPRGAPQQKERWPKSTARRQPARTLRRMTRSCARWRPWRAERRMMLAYARGWPWRCSMRWPPAALRPRRGRPSARATARHR